MNIKRRKESAATASGRRRNKKRDFKSRSEGIGNNRSCLDIFLLLSASAFLYVFDVDGQTKNAVPMESYLREL